MKWQFSHFCCTYLADIPCNVWILEDRQLEWQTMEWEERHKYMMIFIALAFSYKRYFPGRGRRMACLKMVWTFTTSLRWLCLDKWKDEILYFYEEEIKRWAWASTTTTTANNYASKQNMRDCLTSIFEIGIAVMWKCLGKEKTLQIPWSSCSTSGASILG